MKTIDVSLGGIGIKTRAAANPALADFIGSEPADVVTQLLIPDLVGPACELISAVHPRLPPAQAARLESAILSIRPAASHHEQGQLEQRRYRRLVSALSAEHLTNPSLTGDRAAPDPAVDADSMTWGGEERAETVEEDPADAELRQLTTALSSFASTYLNGTASSVVVSKLDLIRLLRPTLSLWRRAPGGLARESARVVVTR
ncbi:hypothetical protein [Streptomyces sp. NPDC088847]|uniref:hypothetical protein n=1 Tax=Streptomyces sp. NPDC088847 TaxID=3365909 RepID=UPI0037FC863B